MGETETLRILETITERAVESDMRGPDQARRQQDRRSREDASREAGNGADVRVRRVVGDRAESRAGQGSGKRQVGREKTRREHDPAGAEARVAGSRHDEDAKTLESQERSHTTGCHACHMPTYFLESRPLLYSTAWRICA